MRTSTCQGRAPWAVAGVSLAVMLAAAGGVRASGATSADTPPAMECAPKPDQAPQWEPLFQGIAYAHLAAREPIPVSVHAVRVILREKGVSFFVTPSNGDAPLETDALKTSTFLVRHRCQVAVNASPFSPVADDESVPQEVLGISISEGTMYSPPHPHYAALLISRSNSARFAVPPVQVGKAHSAVGGFHMLLEDGRNAGTDGERHPRTAVGLSKDGAALYLLVIDGRQPGLSLGTSTAETAAWLLHLGAWQGLNLDGGGSTVLAITDGQGGARVVNSPIHKYLPGLERPVANHLGVRARPLPGAAR